MTICNVHMIKFQKPNQNPNLSVTQHHLSLSKFISAVHPYTLASPSRPLPHSQSHTTTSCRQPSLLGIHLSLPAHLSHHSSRVSLCPRALSLTSRRRTSSRPASPPASPTRRTASPSPASSPSRTSPFVSSSGVQPLLPSGNL
ncbi:hypothetical protein PIB30_015111 [Stylosanthes scabra]|uniref:Uncharacterized protein n=1 Tax=Stylosanthes scabra TaxID=79078 RepID=A0ABU6R791_9FABA|nr:hypothetical protein [Stylosanthes scabra]